MDFSDCFFNEYINEIIMDYLPADTTENPNPIRANNLSLSYCKEHCQFKTLYCTNCTKEICSACSERYHLNHAVIFVCDAQKKSREVASGILSETDKAIELINFAIENAEEESNLIDIKSDDILQDLEIINEMKTSKTFQRLLSLNLKLIQSDHKTIKDGRENTLPPAICPMTPADHCEIRPVRNVGIISRPTNIHLKQTFGNMGSQNGEFYRPWGICVSSRGHFIVSDSGNHRIQIFDNKGTFIRKFGSHGDNLGQFSRPIGVAVTPDDHIVVADLQNRRIQMFTLDGTFVRSFGRSGDKQGEFGYLWDVTCDANGNIIVIDPCNCTIQKFTQTGTLLKSFKFPFDNQHSALRGICITPSNQFIVTDYFRNHLLIVNADLETYKMVELNYLKKGFFCGPQGVVCDKNDNIIVADSKNSKIKAVDMSGNLVYNVLKVDSQPGFDRPNGLCVTAEGRIATVDFGNHNVKIW